MPTIHLTARIYRVIAEGDDAVGRGLKIDEAVALLEFSREHGKRFVAIVDDATGTLVDEDEARKSVVALP
jgi:hypothetical protein